MQSPKRPTCENSNTESAVSRAAAKRGCPFPSRALFAVPAALPLRCRLAVWRVARGHVPRVGVARVGWRTMWLSQAEWNPGTIARRRVFHVSKSAGMRPLPADIQLWTIQM